MQLKSCRKYRTTVSFVLRTGLLLAVVFAAIFFISMEAAASDDELILTILHTNDEHGALIPHSPAVDYHPERRNPAIGGFARLGSAVNEIREQKKAANEPVLLLSAGDFIGGTAYSWLIPEGHAPELTIMQALGYDAVVIGNHEYDYGPDHLAAYLIECGYPGAHRDTAVLASNTVAPTGHPLAEKELYRSYHLLTLENGLKVGLFGLIGKQAVSYIGAADPIEFTDQHEAAAAMVSELRDRGAHIVIALTHSGVEEDRELAQAVHGIDVIIGGHCHSVLEEPIVERDTIIVQAGTSLEHLGRLELAYKPAAAVLRIRNSENNQPFLHKLDWNYPSDPDINLLIDKYTTFLNDYVSEKTAGRTLHILDPVMLAGYSLDVGQPLRETNLGNFITDAMRLATAEKIDDRVDFALQANGQIRGDLLPGSMAHAAGKVSFYDLVIPIGLGMGGDGQAGYSIAAAYLTGDEIYQLLEVAVILEQMMGDTFFLQFSGLRYDYNPQNAVLFTVPFIDLPLVTTRAVVSAERYIGDGRQGFDQSYYVPIEKGDMELYCLATDFYLIGFLPMVGELIPGLDLVLKDSDGNPVPADELESLIVYSGGEEFKVWQAVYEYALSQTAGDYGLPELDPYYAATAGRINPVWTVPHLTWLLLLVFIILFGLILLVWRIKRVRRLRRISAAKGQGS